MFFRGSRFRCHGAVSWQRYVATWAGGRPSWETTSRPLGSSPRPHSTAFRGMGLALWVTLDLPWTQCPKQSIGNKKYTMGRKKRIAKCSKIGCEVASGSSVVEM